MEPPNSAMKEVIRAIMPGRSRQPRVSTKRRSSAGVELIPLILAGCSRRIRRRPAPARGPPDTPDNPGLRIAGASPGVWLPKGFDALQPVERLRVTEFAGDSRLVGAERSYLEIRNPGRFVGQDAEPGGRDETEAGVVAETA